MTDAAARAVAKDERAARVAVRPTRCGSWFGGPIYLRNELLPSRDERMIGN
jgi:hypothetical protein